MSLRTFGSASKTLTFAAVFLSSVSVSQAATNWSASYGNCTSGYTYASTGNWGSIGCANETSPIDTNVAALSWKYSDSNYAPPPTSPTAITAASTAYNSSVVSWGNNGLGVYTLGNTYETHTVDNGTKYIDSIVLEFSQAVTMNELSIGWKSGDADISVFAWQGSTPASSPTPNTLTGGWTTVAQLTDVNVGSSASFTNSVSSSYWLVAALGNDATVDSFKLLSVAGVYGGTTTPPSNGVPEPGSLALLGLGAAGLLAARRKSSARR